MHLPLHDERFLDLLSWWGTPYYFGVGKPGDEPDHWPPADPPKGKNGKTGIDCSGFVQVALVRLGLLSPTAIDRGAAALFDFGKAVPLEEAQFGDLVFYGPPDRIQHVVLFIAPGVILGANGGTSSTEGNDPRAFVRLDRVGYRSDFRGARRLPGAA